MTGYCCDVTGQETDQVDGTLGERVITKLCKTVRDHDVIFCFVLILLNY